MKALVLITGAALAITVPASASAERTRTPAIGPAVFLAGVVAEIAHNDYAHAWLSLFPPHQRVAPLDSYVACESKSPIPGQLDELTVVRSWRTRVAVAGQPHRLAGAAVRFRIVLSDPELALSITLRPMLHAVLWGGTWKWILPAARYSMYRAGTC
jgi:hypothetical protein